MKIFTTQIEKPDEAPVVVTTLEVNEEVAAEQQIAACQEIVQGKLEAVLLASLNNIKRRIGQLALVDERTFIHEIAKFKEALEKIYQEVQFLTYDVEYGFNVKEDRVAVPFKFTGEAMDRLSFLEAVTLVLRLSDTSLKSVNRAIDSFEAKIEEARERLEDAKLADSEKDQATHQSTITSRGEKKAKQEKRRNELVKRINAVLRVSPENIKALMAESEQLLAFLIRGKWIQNYISMDQAKTPTEMLKSFNIIKLVEESEEEETPIQATAKRSLKSKLLNPVNIGVVGLGALMYLFFSYKDHRPLPEPQIYHYMKKVGKTRKVKLLKFSPGTELSDEDKMTISLNNAYEIVKTMMSGAGVDPKEKEGLAGKAPLTYSNVSYLDPVAHKTYAKKFKEEVLEVTPVRTVRHPDGHGFLNTYLIKIRRTMIVRTEFEGDEHPAVERFLEIEALYSEKTTETKPAKSSSPGQTYDINPRNKDIQYRLGRGQDGKAYISITRRDGMAFVPTKPKKKK
ncbi:hypothetical protein ACFL3T_01390 [Patescibacteria group bacterium]